MIIAIKHDVCMSVGHYCAYHTDHDQITFYTHQVQILDMFDIDLYKYLNTCDLFTNILRNYISYEKLKCRILSQIL